MVKLKRFLLHPLPVKLWFFPVLAGLGLAKLAIRMITFKRLVPRLGVSVGVAPWLPVLDAAQERRASTVKQVILLAARHAPWESNCFPQAVVARALLGWYRVPYCVFFGVRRAPSGDRFEAHAWVAAGRVRVSGGGSFPSYTVVGVFAAPQIPDLRAR
ncbi:MAG: lasso peptide biosynthesis B2 protein [Wenzhouxiangella sp.]|nr:lasso peptide biosynthesis B2 protein [Wenzhouxiangella sp.]MCH8476723.1 lasso peptide biosynthesis B2 protein [Wenzhouxiangella sp.]